VSGRLLGQVIDLFETGDGPRNEGDRLVLLVLAWHGHDDGTECRPGMKRSARIAGMPQRTVSWHLTSLRRGGWIEVQRRAAGAAKGQDGKPTAYRIILKRRTQSVAFVSGGSDATGCARPGGVERKIEQSRTQDRAESNATPRRSNQQEPIRNKTAPPPATAKGRGGAQRQAPPEVNPTVRGVAIREAERARAVQCGLCDEFGVIEDSDGSVRRCDHKAR
jgi:hypothetical protein